MKTTTRSKGGMEGQGVMVNPGHAHAIPQRDRQRDHAQGGPLLTAPGPAREMISAMMAGCASCRRVAGEVRHNLRIKLFLGAFRVLVGTFVIGVLSAPQVRLQAQTAFEVASVKANISGERGVAILPPLGGRFKATNITLGLLIRTAYDIEDFQISGGPKWLNNDRYDVEAKAEGNSNLKETRLMLQSLLVERFKLVLHQETKELPVYVLVVAKGGPKLGPPTNPNCLPPPAGSCGGFRITGGNRMVGENVALSQMARVLSTLTFRPVLDRTDLGGVFNVELKWTPSENRPEPLREPDSSTTENNAPSIFTALQEQLGLKLDSEKNRVSVFVIDRAEKPSEN